MGWWPVRAQSIASPSKAEPISAADATTRAWVQLLLTGGGLGVLAAVLPAPWTAAAYSVGSRSTSGDAVGETAMLLAVAILVWALLGWAAIAAGAALLSRVPGTVGRHGDRVLRVVAPAVARKVLLTVVGASMVTGLAACGTSPDAPTSVQENGRPAATTSVASSALPAAQAVARARSWIVVEGSTVHLPPGVAVSGPKVALVLSVDPIGADHDGPAAGAPASSLDIDWPSVTPAPSPPVDVDWPGSTAAAPNSPPTAPKSPSSPRPSSGAEGVVVHRGDSLWSIAARHLPAGSSPAVIEKAWHHWYSANRAVIGNDPNLLLPGQILQPPAPAVPHSTNG